MTACGRKSAFRLQAIYKIRKVTSSALFRFCSGEEWIVVEGEEQLPPLVLKALRNRSPETSSQYFRHFQWSGHCPFFQGRVSFKKGGWGTWRLLPRVPRRGRLSWFHCIQGDAQERFGDCSLYSIIAVGLSVQKMIQK